MDKISINEALVVIAFNRDDIDEGNIIEKLRKAQARILRTAKELDLPVFLDGQQDEDLVDEWITDATANGTRDIFS